MWHRSVPVSLVISHDVIFTSMLGVHHLFSESKFPSGLRSLEDPLTLILRSLEDTLALIPVHTSDTTPLTPP